MPDEGSRKKGNGGRLMNPRAVLSVANNVFGAVLGTAALVFIAKNMGPDMMGILGYTMASIGMLSFLSDFGTGSVHKMQIKSGEDLGKCVGAYAVIKLVLLAVFALAAYTLIELWRNNLLGGTMLEDAAVINSLRVFLIYYVLLGISQIATHTFEGMDLVASVYVPSFLEILVRVSFVIYVATTALGAGLSGPALLASSYMVGVIASTLLVAFLTLQIRVARPDKAILMKYIRSLAPVFLVTMVIVVDLYLDKAIVGYFWGDIEVGLYFGVQKMAVFVSVFALAVATIILPSVTTYYTRKDLVASWDVVNQAERYVSLLVIPTATFYLMWGSQILTVFLTRNFASDVRVMDLLVMSSTLTALVLPLRSAIAGAGSPRTLFGIGVGGLALQVILMLLLVPRELFELPMLGLKGLGAALALLLTSVYMFFALRYMAWRTARIVPNSGSFRHLVGAAVMVGVMYVVAWLFFGTIGWTQLVVLAGVGGLSYGVTAYALGELEPSDYKYFRVLLNPQGTLQYVVHELLGRRAQ